LSLQDRLYTPSHDPEAILAGRRAVAGLKRAKMKDARSKFLSFPLPAHQLKSDY